MTVRAMFFTLLVGCHPWAAHAQATVSAVDHFRSASQDDRRQALIAIVVHESKASAAERVAIISLALSDVTLREGALAAIVSRAAAPALGPPPRGIEELRREWTADRMHLQALRPAIEQALRDADERVRAGAIAALASLDLDEDTLSVRLSPRTQRLFLDLYDFDSSSRVRSRIVEGFATESAAPTPEVQELLARAFADPDPAVRQAATRGAEKLSTDVAMALLAIQLVDESRDVRLQAAVTVTKMGVRASAHREFLRFRLSVETDQRVRQMLEVAVKVTTEAN